MLWCRNKKDGVRAGEIAWWVRAPVALSEDPGWIPSTIELQFTNIHCFESRGICHTPLASVDTACTGCTDIQTDKAPLQIRRAKKRMEPGICHMPLSPTLDWQGQANMEKVLSSKYKDGSTCLRSQSQGGRDRRSWSSRISLISQQVRRKSAQHEVITPKENCEGLQSHSY